jgi:hypothetical protein
MNKIKPKKILVILDREEDKKYDLGNCTIFSILKMEPATQLNIQKRTSKNLNLHNIIYKRIKYFTN